MSEYMWNQWVKKIKELFDTEKDEPIHNQQSTKLDNEIRSKVTYQYPNKNTFRFPVIPDQQEPGNTSDTPAFQRKRRKRSTDSNETQRENSREETAQTQKVSIGTKKEGFSTPFRPTEVPSPIYGYQPRYKTKKIDNEPAFVRNQVDSHQNDLNPKEEMKEEVVNQENEESTTSILKEDSIEAAKPEQSTNQEIKRTKRNERRSRQERKKKRSTNNHVPFNVMMSANDKRRQVERVRSTYSKEQEYHSKEEGLHSIPYYLLNDPVSNNEQDQLWVRNQQELLEKTLKHFNVRATVVNTTQGPSVTRFEVQPELGVKVSKVKNLSDDLKLNMAAKDIRIEAPIPGKNTIGIEIPNPNPQMVGLQEIFGNSSFKDNPSPLTIGLGLNIEGEPLITNIQKMPHGLIAGATGSGKSVCINTILVSLLYKANHEDVKFLLIDPKMVELAPYNGIPHLLSPVITDVKAATMALKWAVREMEERYDKLAKEGVRDIEKFNQKMVKQQRKEEKMPFVVIVIDELADLMMVSPQDVEDAISRIAQKARACGIHLLLATQRPSVDVITGLIKANIPTRIAFSVSSQVDSRTIIDTSGAEKLLGKGDMLFNENGTGKNVRLQGAFVSDEEIERITDYARSMAEPNYIFEQEQLLQQIESDEEDVDDLLEEAIRFVVHHNSASTSLLQRQFKIGYNRAARLMDSMEANGIIAGQNGSKPRDVLVTPAQAEEIYHA
ncbi:DNA translocase FtsK [Virgibacillus byunsanensis]|uniref:DNA translocase FtsK n=1 Tax=Virgibacillus byunsanensis TaxID=570945 RepID=A0ABW3LLM7_9BACI